MIEFEPQAQQRHSELVQRLQLLSALDQLAHYHPDIDHAIRQIFDYAVTQGYVQTKN
jgi:hypothetical protein